MGRGRCVQRGLLPLVHVATILVFFLFYTERLHGHLYIEWVLWPLDPWNLTTSFYSLKKKSMGFSEEEKNVIPEINIFCRYVVRATVTKSCSPCSCCILLMLSVVLCYAVLCCIVLLCVGLGWVVDWALIREMPLWPLWPYLGFSQSAPSVTHPPSPNIILFFVVEVWGKLHVWKGQFFQPSVTIWLMAEDQMESDTQIPFAALYRQPCW